jgi:acetamidase/formamidase
MMLRITRDKSAYSLDKAHAPVAVIDPGAELLFETGRAHGRHPKRAGPPSTNHPRAQPGHRSGVRARREPGDALVVHILDIASGERGYTGTRPAKASRAHDLRAPTKLSRLRTAWSPSTTGSLPGAPHGRRDRHGAW